MSEAAEESPAESDSDRELLIASALHAMLQVTENTWPIHAGGPPERLLAAMHAGQAALARSRSATPPRAAAAMAVEAASATPTGAASTSADTAPSLGSALQQQRPPNNILTSFLGDLRSSACLQAEQELLAAATLHATSSGNTPPEALQFIMARMADRLEAAEKGHRSSPY